MHLHLGSSHKTPSIDKELNMFVNHVILYTFFSHSLA